jgi:uncharacterized phage protein (TIGR01671 family)
VQVLLIGGDKTVRDIKFRAWDDTEKRMHTKTLIGNITDQDSFDYTAHCIYRNGTWVHIDEHDTDVVFEQYTGLKDKNWVDIYEGDVLRCQHNHLWVVSFSERGCFTACDPEDYLDYVLLDDWDFIVIGNIHQNPELLK